LEPHKILPAEIEELRPIIDNGPEKFFEKAYAFMQKYYAKEAEQIGSVKFDEVTPDHFFNEYTWVVHATGFSAKAVGKFMPRLMEAYGGYDSLSEQSYHKMFARVKKVCNNPQKAKAIYKTACLMKTWIEEDGWESTRKIRLGTPDALSKLPCIGKITCYHLGRNIGLLDCVKPDLHLVRLADHWGISSCEEMCRIMRGDKDIPLGIVDLAVWYAASTFGTMEVKKDGQR